MQSLPLSLTEYYTPLYKSSMILSENPSYQEGSVHLFIYTYKYLVGVDIYLTKLFCLN